MKKQWRDDRDNRETTHRLKVPRQKDRGGALRPDLQHPVLSLLQKRVGGQRCELWGH